MTKEVSGRLPKCCEELHTSRYAARGPVTARDDASAAWVFVLCKIYVSALTGLDICDGFWTMYVSNATQLWCV